MGVVRHRVLTSVLIGLALVVWAYADSLALAIVAAALGGLGMAGGQLIWMIGSLEFTQRDGLSTYASIHTFLTGLRGVIAPAFGVWLVHSPLLGGEHRFFFLGAAVLVFLSAAGHGLFVRLPSREERRAGSSH